MAGWNEARELSTGEVNMDLFDDLYEAKEALKNASKTMDDMDKTDFQRLSAFAEAMRAEATIQFIQKGSYDDFWEEKYDAIVEFKKAYSCADSKAQKAAEQARKTAYSKVMNEEYKKLPAPLKEKMCVEINTHSWWEFTTEY